VDALALPAQRDTEREAREHVEPAAGAGDQDVPCFVESGEERWLSEAEHAFQISQLRHVGSGRGTKVVT
jgi:hypothetical protein